MRKVASLLVLLLLINSSSVLAQERSSSLDAFWDELTNAIWEGDFETYSEMFAPDAIHRASNGTEEQYSQLLSEWSDKFRAVRQGKRFADYRYRVSDLTVSGTRAEVDVVVRTVEKEERKSVLAGFYRQLWFLRVAGDGWMVERTETYSRASHNDFFSLQPTSSKEKAGFGSVLHVNVRLPGGGFLVGEELYEGQLKNGIPHGFGELTDPFPGEFSGSYVGDFREGLFHGFGTHGGGLGWEYQGNFADGVREGFGTSREPLGEVYEGNWKDGKRSGYGKTTKDGTTTFDEWREGEKLLPARVSRRSVAARPPASTVASPSGSFGFLYWEGGGTRIFGPIYSVGKTGCMARGDFRRDRSDSAIALFGGDYRQGTLHQVGFASLEAAQEERNRLIRSFGGSAYWNSTVAGQGERNFFDGCERSDPSHPMRLASIDGSALPEVRRAPTTAEAVANALDGISQSNDQISRQIQQDVARLERQAREQQARQRREAQAREDERRARQQRDSDRRAEAARQAQQRRAEQERERLVESQRQTQAPPREPQRSTSAGVNGGLARILASGGSGPDYLSHPYWDGVEYKACREAVAQCMWVEIEYSNTTRSQWACVGPRSNTGTPYYSDSKEEGLRGVGCTRFQVASAGPMTMCGTHLRANDWDYITNPLQKGGDGVVDKERDGATSAFPPQRAGAAGCTDKEAQLFCTRGGTIGFCADWLMDTIPSDARSPSDRR